MRPALFIHAPILAIGIAGCAGTSPPPAAPSDVRVEAQQVEPAPSPPPAAAAPVAPPPAPSTAGGQAQPVAPAAAGAATPILMGLGQAEVPGARPEGGPFAGSFQEGQTLAQPFNLQPGKCYSVVAAGMGVSQVDVQIVAQPAPMFPPTVLAQSTGTGPSAVLGGKATGCFKNPVPLSAPAQVVLRATRGAGMIAAQIYVK